MMMINKQVEVVMSAVRARGPR